MIDRSAIDEALDRVVDPCSNALGEPLGLREMGLTSTVEIDDGSGSVDVTMRLTSPCCAYGATMALAAERELICVSGVRSATVTIDHSAVWTPAQILPTASARLGDRRARTLAVTDLKPHDWSTWNPRPGQHGSDPCSPSSPDQQGESS
ncbi:MAG: iron-sulfur cluster assembly protein [Ilumatobacteraceae bacterium]|nr:iron-sulfur cluster assembly protein [Ilumatobacteraceae bacterium]